MTKLADELEGEEESGHLRHVVDDGGNAKECWTSTIVLKVPEQEGKDESTANAHDPGGEHKDQESQVGHGPEDGVELGHGPELLSKDLGLLSHLFQSLFVLRLLDRCPVLLHVGHGHVLGDDRVAEGDLGGHQEGAEHEEGKDGEADVVVSLRVVHVALGVGVPVKRDNMTDAYQAKKTNLELSKTMPMMNMAKPQPMEPNILCLPYLS